MFRLILLATVGLAAALDAAGPSIRTKDGNMIVNLKRGKTFSVSCPGEGDDAYDEGFKSGSEEAKEQADSDCEIKVSTANDALKVATTESANRKTLIEQNEATIETKETKIVEQDGIIAKASEELATCKANEANCASSDSPQWATISATMSSGVPSEAAMYVVGPSGGAPLYVSGVGFGDLEKSLGSWSPWNVACIFTPSTKGAKVVKVPTSMVDGAVAGSRLLTCEIPPIASGTTAKVTLTWSNGKPVALYKSFDGTNTLYSASWYTGIKLVDGHPTISGVGFSEDADYTCLWAVAGTVSQTDRTTAVYVSPSTLKCNVNLDAKGAVLAVYNGNQKMQVVVSPQIGANGKNYKDLAATKPSSIPFHTDMPNGKALVYPYKQTACGDLQKTGLEIGVDCGLKACGKKCVWDGGQGSIAEGKACDAHSDCETKNCDAKKGVCSFSHYSCYNVKQSNKDARSGFYKIAIDKNWRSFDKEIDTDGKLHEVYCDFYDGRAFTLFEMICSSANNAGTSPYDHRGKTQRHPSTSSNIGQMYKSNQNQCARQELDFINSIFKHSEGYVMTRWNNNKPEHHVTDVFGAPENGKHILAKAHSCSHKSQFNLAAAYRAGTNGANAGMCFKDGGSNRGQINQVNNCVCGDKTGHFNRYNSCGGDYGNFRRYNGKQSRKKFCSYMSSKCNSYPHGVLGDTGGCNIPGQRTIQGHFWISHAGRTGTPCSSYYGAYGCYGSRWIA